MSPKILKEKPGVVSATLSNGIALYTDPMPALQSVAVSIWVKVGSRDEPEHLNGVTHFLEHMVFKGTKHRTQKEISAAFDRVGGSFNAFTSREYICFYARVADMHLPMALEILSDMVTTAKLSNKDIAMEKNVICEEIRMVEDTPDEALYDQYLMAIHAGHPVSLPIQGTEKSVMSFAPAEVRRFFKETFTARNMMVVVSGSGDPKRVKALAARHLGRVPKGRPCNIETLPPYKAGVTGRAKRDLEQVQLVAGWRAFAADDKRRPAVLLLQNLLGGTSSSLLYQRLREKEGLVYNVYASYNPYRDDGLFNIGAGTGKHQAHKALKAILDEVGKVKKGKYTDEALAIARENIVGSMALAMESPSSRMMRIASSVIHLGRVVLAQEILRDLARVTKRDLTRLANEIFREDTFSFSWLGPEGAFPKKLSARDLHHP